MLSACTRTSYPHRSTPQVAWREAFVPGKSTANGTRNHAIQVRAKLDGTYNGRTTLLGLFEPVYFNFDSSSIAASERSKLQEAAKYLSKNKGSGVLLEGRCDWYGTADYNLALGEQRANSARTYLSTLGVKDSQIEILSKGQPRSHQRPVKNSIGSGSSR